MAMARKEVSDKRKGAGNSAANSNSGLTRNDHAVSPLSRARTRARAMRGSSFLSSGPCSRPVSASRSGWKSARPLAPVAAVTAVVQAPQLPCVPGLGGKQFGHLREKHGLLDHRRDRPGHEPPQFGCIGKPREIRLRHIPETGACGNAECLEPAARRSRKAACGAAAR